ncbi:MAG: phosphatidate cytidylyltransferase [Planctomycetia bacterium]|nr:phosphatidate cytidylyltransferase [Planctomycetia bacterium]
MLQWRITFGVLFSGAVAALCWLDARAATAGVWLLPLALIVALLGSGELVRMFASRLPAPVAWVVHLGNAGIVAANFAPRLSPQVPLGDWGWPAAALALAMLVALVAEMARFQEAQRHVERLALSAFAFVYIGVLLSFAVQLRFVGPDAAWGLAALVSLIVVVKFSDIGAYTVGRLVGRHKLAPRLSPGKTVEGAIGGVALACFGSWLALVVLFPLVTGSEAPLVAPWRWIAFGVVVSAAGMFGDLAESLLKRDLRVKDSSAWMPGFGGVLDLIDSILVAAPVAYLCWQLGLVGS